VGINLPNSGNVFIPEVPSDLDAKTAEYLRSFKRSVEKAVRDQFSNNLVLANVINLGVSGTFIISSGGSIVVTSGIVISVTS
jgi:hypothetical protein